LLSDLVRNYLDRIKELVDSGDYANARYGIQLIQTQVQSTLSDIKEQKANLNIFKSVMQDDQTRFLVLSTSVPEAFNGDIKNLSGQVVSLQAQIAADNKKIARGATDTVVKILALEAVIAISVGVSFVTFPVAAGAGQFTVLAAKAANTLIKTGSSTAKDTAEKELKATIGGDDFLDEASGRIETLRNISIRLANEQASLVVFQTVSAQVQQIVEAVKDAITQLDALSGALEREVYPFQIIAVKYDAQTPYDLSNVTQNWVDIGKATSRLTTSYLGLNAGGLI